jgi:hypothetical protein
MLLVVIDLVIKIIRFGRRGEGVDWRQTALACVFEDSVILAGDFASWVAVFLPSGVHFAVFFAPGSCSVYLVNMELQDAHECSPPGNSCPVTSSYFTMSPSLSCCRAFPSQFLPLYGMQY